MIRLFRVDRPITVETDNYKLRYNFQKAKSLSHIRFINGWQLAKMKKSIPDMSLP